MLTNNYNDFVYDIYVDLIDSKSLEIRPEDDTVYSSMEDLADELPESSPRFILLSHPLKLVGLLYFFLLCISYSVFYSLPL